MSLNIELLVRRDDPTFERMITAFVVTTPRMTRSGGWIYSWTDFYGESVKDRADLKHVSSSLAFIFLIVILFCKQSRRVASVIRMITFHANCFRIGFARISVISFA